MRALEDKGRPGISCAEMWCEEPALAWHMDSRSIISNSSLPCSAHSTFNMILVPTCQAYEGLPLTCLRSSKMSVMAFH